MMIFSGIVSLAALFMTFFLAMLCWEDRCEKSRRPNRLSNAIRLPGRGSSARRSSVVKLATQRWDGGSYGAVLTMRPQRSAGTMARKAANAGGRQTKAR